MADLIKMVTWDNDEDVTPQDDAVIYETAIPESGFFYGGEVTRQGSNTLHVAAAHGIIRGRKFTISEGTITVPLTSSGTLRGRLYIHADLSNAAEPIQLLYETGTTLSPEVQETNFNIINGVWDMNIATFEVTEVTIRNVSALMPKASNANNEGIAPNPMIAKNVSARDGHLRITFTPPNDTVIEGSTLCYVGGVKLVRKEGVAPTTPDDGTLVFDLDRDHMHQYVSTPYVDDGLLNGTTYYYKFFPYSQTGVVNVSDAAVSGTPQPYNLFAFHYSENNSSPASVTYPAGCDNAGFTPAQMDFATNVMNYGSWDPEDEATRWLFPRSCMLKYDGTVDYYLDENDETKKADGTASDVANSNYAGNAMMEWGRDGRKLYWKVVPDTDGKGFTFYVANAKVDDDFEAWNHYNANGQLVDHFYTPKYFGGHDGTRLRSISGISNYVNTAGTNEIAKAKANNPSGSAEMWNIENWCDRFLIWMLLCMMGKNTNTQEVYGQGRCASGNQSAVANNTLNGKGMFCGYNNQTSDVKVFGMQGWWGNLWRRCNGLINDWGTVKVKLTYGQADGSTVNGYNTDGTGYINQGTIGGGTSGGSISHCNITKQGVTPNTMSGAGNTYYCDGGWFNNSQNNFAIVGGGWSNSALVGAGCVALGNLVSPASANLGAALSCKPLA